MNEKPPKKSLISSAISFITKSYKLLINSEQIVWLSSLSFLYWFLEIFLNKDTIFAIFILLPLAFMWYIILSLKNPGRTKRIENLSKKYFFRILNIPVSILILLLILNSYFKVLNSINQKFLIRVEEIEFAFGSSLFPIIFSFTFIFFFFFFFDFLYRLLRERVKIKKLFRFGGELIIALFIIVSGFMISFLVERQLIELFGISVFFLHFNYLIREATRFLSGKPIPDSL